MLSASGACAAPAAPRRRPRARPAPRPAAAAATATATNAAAASRSPRSVAATAAPATACTAATASLPSTSATAPPPAPAHGAAATAAPPLRLGPSLVLDPPLLSAPMAGISAAPYRMLAVRHGAAMACSEMVIASALVLGNARTRQIAAFDPRERVRSVQLYGVRPEQVEQAVRLLVAPPDGGPGVQHVDLNFGCPVRKVTARGGGAALPLRPRLFARCEGAGGEKAPADWGAVGRLAGAVRIPVIGNGDVYCGADAVRMMAETGCAGVMVGRAALGRPWVFAEVAAALAGRAAPPPPRLGSIVATALEHVEAEVAWALEHGDTELDAVRRFRKLVPLYTLGFASAAPLRAALLAADSLAAWRAAAAAHGVLYDAAEPFPAAAALQPRLKGGGRLAPYRLALPDGWLQEEGGGGARAEAALTDAACEG